MKKRFWSILPCCALVLSLLPCGVPPARAAAENWSGNVCFYSDTILSSGVTLSGATTLTVAAGRTLIIENGVDCGQYTLTFAGAGSVVVTGCNGSGNTETEGNGGIGICGSVVQSGGTLTVTGGDGNGGNYGDGGDGVYGSVTLNGGTLTVTGGNGGGGNYGASDGGSGIVGSVTLNGGTLTVTGGNGSFGFNGGLGGKGIHGGVILDGGRLTAVGGNGGSAGDGGGGNGGSGIVVNGASTVELMSGELTARGGNGGSGGYSSNGGDGIVCDCAVAGGILTARGGSGIDGSHGEGDPAQIGCGIVGSVELAGGAVRASGFRTGVNGHVTVVGGKIYTINGNGSYAGDLSGSSVSDAADKWLTTGYKTGSCGAGGVKYELIENGGAVGSQTARTLLISGTGAMPDYNAEHPAPWRQSPVTRAMIGDRISNVSAGAFSGCASLAAIYIDGSNPGYRSEDGVLLRSGDSETELTVYPAGRSGADYTVPNGVASIGAGAFSGCASLSSIAIPASVTRIGADAFSGCVSLASFCVPFDFDKSLLSGSGIPASAGTKLIPCVTVTAAPGEYIAASVSGSHVAAPVNSVLIAASYDSTGRLVDVRLHELTAPMNDEMYAFDGFKTGAGYTCKLMLADRTTHAPLCGAWTGGKAA